MDSTALLCRLLADGYTVSCISKITDEHVIEIERAQANIEYLAKITAVEHRIVDLSGVMGIFNSALTKKDIEIPEGHYEEEQMKATVVPNRNVDIFIHPLRIWPIYSNTRGYRC